MAENLNKTLKIEDTEYNINAVYSDEAGKVTNTLTITSSGKDGGETTETFNGSASKSINYVPSDGGTFRGPVYLANPSDQPGESEVITSSQVDNRIVNLTGVPLNLWDADCQLTTVKDSTDKLHNINIVVGSAQDFTMFKKYATGASIGLKYSNYWGNLRVAGIGECTDTDILIPEYSEDGTKITEIGVEAFKGNTEITSVVIPESVTSIGLGAFNGCTNLKTVIISDNVLSIAGEAFRGCSSLTQIRFGAKINTIGTKAANSSTTGNVFRGCTSLTEIILPDSLENLYGYNNFSDCTALTTVHIPSSTTSISPEAFSGCTNLAEVVISNGVKSIETRVFKDCNNLKSITIPASVTTIASNAFANSNLINISYHGKSADWTELATNAAVPSTAAVSSLFDDYTFTPDNETNPTSYTISKYTSTTATFISIPLIYKGLPVKSIAAEAFKGCSKLTEVVVPNGIETIGAGAFSGCSSLEKITLPFIGSTVSPSKESESTVFGYIFGKTSYSGGIATKQEYNSSSSSNATFYVPEKLTTVIINGGKILYGAFCSCKTLREVTLPAVAKVGNYIFKNCTALTTIYYGGSRTDLAGISGIDSAMLDKVVITKPVNSSKSSIETATVTNGPFIYICKDEDTDSTLASNRMFLKLPDSTEIIEISKGADRLNSTLATTNNYYTYEGLAEIIARINTRLDALGGEDLKITTTAFAPLHDVEEINTLITEEEKKEKLPTATIPTVQDLQTAIIKMSGIEVADSDTTSKIDTFNKDPNNKDTLAKLREDLTEFQTSVTTFQDNVEYELNGGELGAAIDYNNTRVDKAESKLNTVEDRLAAEESTRKDADDELAAGIKAEREAREQADKEEKEAREQADKGLTASIATEEETRKQADDAEKEARKQADDALAASIEAEQAEREAMDQTLQNNLNDVCNGLASKVSTRLLKIGNGTLNETQLIKLIKFINCIAD